MHCPKQLIALALAFAAPLAAAEEKAPAKKPAGGAAIAVPAPPPELAQMKDMIGNWKCSSKMYLPPEMGGEQSGTSTMAIKKDLDGFWLVGQWKMGKTKTLPGMKGTFYWGYDSAEKKFVEFGADNTGGFMRGTSDGPQGGVWVWSEEGTMMGKKNKSRTTVTQKTPDTTQVKSEMEAEPGKWIPMGEDDCKKQAGSA